MSEYLDNLVKCFSNSSIGVNLTTVLIDNEPWFIAKEVADILGYENAPQAIRTNVNELDQKMLSCAECKEIFSDLLTIDEEDSLHLNTKDQETVGSEENLKVLQHSTLRNPISVSNRGMKLINEPGLYSLIFSSKKPEAQQFQRWVTSEVLPCLRKTGSYSVQPAAPQTYLEALKALVASEEEKEQLRLANETLRDKLDDMGEELEIAIIPK